MTTSQNVRLSLVSCLQQHIQCICNYLPYLQLISSILNPRMRHAVVTGTQVTWVIKSRRVRWVGHVAHMLAEKFL